MESVMSRPGHAAALHHRRPTRRPTAKTGGRRTTDAVTTYRDLLGAAADARNSLPLKLGDLIEVLEQQPGTNSLRIDWDSGVFHPGLGPNFGYVDALVIEIGAEQPCTVAEFIRRLRDTHRPPDTDVWADWWGRTTDTQVHGVVSAGGITVIVTSAV